MKMNTDLISQALCFHGQPLQKIWAGERGDHDLYQLGITNPDFSVYLERQKNLTFQDRAKRLKLHQFLARKASELFDRGLQCPTGNGISDTGVKGRRQDVAETIVSMPPYEYFLSSASEEKSKVLHCTLEAVKPGIIVYGVVTKPYSSGTQIKVLCTGEPLVRYLADINMRALLPNAYMIPGHDKKGNPKSYAVNDFVCCEVLDISVDAERMTLGMKGVITKDTTAPLGLISLEQIPDYYRRILSDSNDIFVDYLTVSKTFNNTNCYEMLYEAVGLDINDTYSHLKSLKHRFPSQDYAIELRQTQASKWAFRSVADGIEHFKIGRHVEAFQCLNKALSIDPRNVEGLVARGALYANKGSFIKAVEDFETALKLNAFHTNARKYMGETLVALGRSYEEENQLEEAVKAYQNCLNIIPNHEQARISLDALKRRPGLLNPVIDVNLLSIPGTSELKKKKKSKHRSSSSSSNSADSAQSSSDDSSSDDSSASDSEAEKQKKKHRKQKSLSPLSKRMNDMSAGTIGGSSFEFSQPFHMMQKNQPDYNKMDDFLGADDDYETRVQKLLKDASKHRKERDGKSSGNKKKSKKKRKKAKKEVKEKKAKQEASAFDVFKPTDEASLHASLEKYERSLQELKTYQQQQNLAPPEEVEIDNEEPPPAPSFSIRAATVASPRRSRLHQSPSKATTVSRQPPQPSRLPPQMSRPLPDTAPSKAPRQQQSQFAGRSGFSSKSSSSAASFKPFPIKGPVVLDKFGCFRLVAPPADEVTALARPSARSRSRSKSRSRQRSSHARRRSRSRSIGRGRRRRSKSPQRRRSTSRNRRRSRSLGSRRRSRSKGRRSRSKGRRPRTRSRSRDTGRRAASPFNPNRRPRPGSPGHRIRLNEGYRNKKLGFAHFMKTKYGNKVWQRKVDEDEKPNGAKSSTSSPKDWDSKEAEAVGSHAVRGSVDGKWQHDKFVKEDGISLEEIDKIITQAKKDRKEEILQRDKQILKKNAANSF